MKVCVRRAVDSTVLALVTCLLVTSVLYARGETERDYPEEIGEGVLCSGPQVSLSWLPQIERYERPCPLILGDGVLCRGPDVPEGMQATDPTANSGAEAGAEGILFIPALSR